VPVLYVPDLEHYAACEFAAPNLSEKITLLWLSNSCDLYLVYTIKLSRRTGSTSWLYVSWTSQLDVCLIV